MSEQPKKPRPINPRNGAPVPEGRPFSGEHAREAGRNGGLKSVAVRRAKKTLCEELLMLLNNNITTKDGKKMSTQGAISASLVHQALKGNVRAFETIRDTIGQKPVEKVAVSLPDAEIVSTVEMTLFGDDPL